MKHEKMRHNYTALRSTEYSYARTKSTARGSFFNALSDKSYHCMRIRYLV